MSEAVGSPPAAPDDGSGPGRGPAARRDEPRVPGAGLVEVAGRLNRALTGGAGLNEPDPDARPPAPAEARRNLPNLALGLGLLLAVAGAAHALTTVAVVLGLIVIVMLHEAGHFITAKRSGMKVTEYFVGFGPRLWSFRRGETEYGIKAIPAGGYVRIVGMNNLDPVDPADEARSYRQQSFPKRLVVALAGSTVHFLIALLLLFVLNTSVGVTNFNKPLMRIQAIEGLTTGQSPAQQAGFKPGDVILSYDGHVATSFEDLRAYIQAKSGVAITFVVRRAGQQVTLVGTPVNLQSVTPKDPTTGQADNSPPPTTATGFLGIAPAVQKDRANPVIAVGRSFRQFGSDVWLTLKGLGSLFSLHGMSSYGHQLFGNTTPTTPAEQANRPVSAVGIVHLTNQAVKQGAEPLLEILIAINVVIGLINLTPLPPFDGGLVAVAVYERLRSRRGRRYRVDMNRMLPVAYAVLLALVFLFVSSLYLDITHPL